MTHKVLDHQKKTAFISSEYGACLGYLIDETMRGRHMPSKVIHKIKVKLKFICRQNKFQPNSNHIIEKLIRFL